MPTPYELPSIMLRNARYRGHRESEKRLGSHNEQVFDIHRIANKLMEQKKEINNMTKQWFEGDMKVSEVISTINVTKTFPANASQTMYHVITQHDLRKVKNVVVELNSVTIPKTEYEVLHGSVYIDLESAISIIPVAATLTITMTVDVAVSKFNNAGVHTVKDIVRNLDERIKEAERKYIEYEDAFE